MVPLLRPDCPGDLRLAPHRFAAHLVDVVQLDAGCYVSYVPQALVAAWTTDGSPAALGAASLRGPEDARKPRLVLQHSKMTQRLRGDTLRLLPLHLAMSGFLESFFSGPAITWEGWTSRAVRRGLSPRLEHSLPGAWVPDLAEALRLFEVHADQVGVLLFVGDRLASARVFAHPDDYRALHATLLNDFYAEDLQHFGAFPGALPDIEAPMEGAVDTLDDLVARAAEHRQRLADSAASLAQALFTQPVRLTPVYEAGPFRLCRFIGGARAETERHIGECILRTDGTLGYLATYRMNREQAARFDLLEHLAGHAWHPGRAAEALGLTLAELAARLTAVGLEGLLHVDAPPKGGRA